MTQDLCQPRRLLFVFFSLGFSCRSEQPSATQLSLSPSASAEVECSAFNHMEASFAMASYLLSTQIFANV